MIAQPQYAFAPTDPMMGFKEGGLASLADKVQNAGRRGDTMLVHMRPDEVADLNDLAMQDYGRPLSINPATGLPEAGLFKDLKRGAKNFLGGVGKTLAPLAPILPFLPIPGLFGLSSLLTKSLLTGALAGFDRKGNFDLKRGAKAGLLSYGLGSLMQNAAAQGAPNAAGTGGPYDISDVRDPTAAVNMPTPDVSIPTDTGAAVYGQDVVTPTPSVEAAVRSSVGADVGEIPNVTSFSGSEAATKVQPPLMNRITEGISSLPGKAVDYVSALPGKALDYAAENPIQATLAGISGYGSVKSLQEAQEQKKEAERILAERNKRTAEEVAFAEQVLRDYPIQYRRFTGEDVAAMGMAGGGLAGLNAFKSGGQPRFLAGGGDGMSDDIPATIGGRQKAALSDGEFVIPADVVSHLGNGSSRAGAKKLYSMMDNIRQARTGKKRQAPSVKAERYMPA